MAAREDLELRFTNKSYALSRLLLIDGDERSELGWETHERVRKERLIAQTANFDSQDFEDFLRDCAEIIGFFGPSSAEHFQVQGGVSDVLLAVAERDPELYEIVFDRYLHSGSSLLGPAALVNRLIEVRSADRAYEIISTGDYSGRTSWLLYYFNGVSSEEMTYERLGQLYSVYETVTSRDFVPSLGYLLRLPIDKRAKAVTTVIGILLDKIQSDPGVGKVLSSVFDGHSELGDVVFETLADHVDLLESAYLAACEAAQGTDNSGSFFSRLLDLDATFVERWASWWQRQDWINRHEGSRDYSFLWRRDDYKPILLRIIDVISARPEDRFSFYFDAQVYFRLRGSESGQAIIRQRQDELLDELIRDRYSDQDFMVFLFQIISGFPAECRRSRIATFLHYSQDFEAFRRLPLEPSSWSWEGSAVPLLQKRVNFLESLLPSLNAVDLLSHRQLVEQEIESLQRQIEHEKKEDFIGF